MYTAEFTCRGSVIDSDTPVMSATEESSVEGTKSKVSSCPLRRIVERPMSYWTAAVAPKIAEPDTDGRKVSNHSLTIILC